jgi:hypothetical protein
MIDEWKHQVIVVEWLKQKHPDILYWFTPNEANIPVQYRVKLERMGLTSGVADLFFPKGNDEYNGMCLEMKREDGRLSKNQVSFLTKMNLMGYYAVPAYGSEEAINFIKLFYNLEN